MIDRDALHDLIIRVRTESYWIGYYTGFATGICGATAGFLIMAAIKN